MPAAAQERDSMKLSDARTLYLQYRKEAGFSENTVINDRQAIDRLIRAVGDIDMAKVSPLHIDRVMGAGADAGHSPGTLNVTQAFLSSFFKWGRTRKVTPRDHDPIAGRRYRQVLPTKRLRIPLGMFPHVLDCATRPRDRMLIAMGLYLMVRQSELINIRIKDVDLASGEIFVHVRKTKEYDRMPITKELRRELNLWLPIYAEECGELQPDWFLVPALHHKPRSTDFYIAPTSKISESAPIVRRVLERAGFKDEARVGVHVLRASAARAAFDELAAQGYDGALRRVSAWLHHSSTRTSEIYLGLDLDKATRNADYRDKPLYPSLDDDNVVPIRRDGDEDGSPASAVV